MANYSRKCRTCGRWINLRQMPHGQWVAFEGDEPHKCKKPPVIKPKPKAQPKPMPPGGDFPPINIPGDTAQRPTLKPAPTPPPTAKPQARPTTPEFPPISIPNGGSRKPTPSPPYPAPKPMPVPPKNSSPEAQPSGEPRRSGGNWGWLWWMFAIFLMLGILRVLAHMPRRY